MLTQFHHTIKQILLVFMKENLQYFESSTTIDLRNCKYQGLVNSKNQWHGFGIVLDDDMTICCSEWDNDQLSGDTFVLKMNGSLLYGRCKANGFHKTTMFKNDAYSILAGFSEGKPQGKAVAFDKTMTNALIFNSQELTNKKIADQPFYMSFISIKEIKKQKEIIQNVARLNSIQIKSCQIDFLQFLKNIYKKYERILTFFKKDRGYFFGFRNGLGFQFIIEGNVHSNFDLLSVGVYGKSKSLQIGLKLHNKRCYEEGNFHCKETITYSHLLDRPQKCRQTYQKVHRQSLNFINKYFYLRDNYLNIFQDFIAKKLQRQIHLAISLSHQRKKFKIQDQVIKKPEKSKLKENRSKSFTNDKQTRDKSPSYKPKQTQKSINEKRRGLAYKEDKQSRKQNKLGAIIKNKSLIDLKPKERQPQYTNNFKQINTKKRTQIPKLQLNQMQVPKQSSLIRKQISSQQLSMNFAHNSSSKSKVYSQHKSIARINEQKIRQQLYVNELKLETNPIRVISQLSNQSYLQQITNHISPPKQKYSNLLKQHSLSDFDREFQNLENRRMKLLNQFKFLNHNYERKRSSDLSSEQYSQTNQINMVTQIQPPISNKKTFHLNLRPEILKKKNEPYTPVKKKG